MCHFPGVHSGSSLPRFLVAVALFLLGEEEMYMDTNFWQVLVSCKIKYVPEIQLYN